MVNNSWLDNFSSFKYTPCNSIYIIVLNILVAFSCKVDSLIRNIFILWEMINHKFYNTWMYQNFIICLLVDIPIFRSPSVFRIRGFYSINWWLRIDCQKIMFVQRYKVITDIFSFFSNRAFTEWEFPDFSLNERNKYLSNLRHILTCLPPHLQLFLNIGISKLFTIWNKPIIVVKSWRSTISPSTIRKFVPSLCLLDITFWLVSPKDWSYIFIFSFSWELIKW